MSEFIYQSISLSHEVYIHLYQPVSIPDYIYISLPLFSFFLFCTLFIGI